LGQPAQNYPQNPIISIPMLLTLLFSAGLIASAQQDSPNAFEAIEPTIYLENPEILGLEANYNFPSQLDTVKKEMVIQKTESTSDAPMVWTTDSGEKIIIKSNGSNSYTYKISADTVITNGDTLIVKGNKNFIFKNGDGIDWATMPKMEFDFPQAPTAPNFPEAPISFFEMSEMPPMPEMAPMAEMPPMPEMEGFEFFNSGSVATVYRTGKNGVFISRDTTEMTKADKEKWAEEMEKQANEWAKRSEEMMKEWEPQMKAWEEKMEAWQKSNEPKMKEFEKQMEEWQEKFQPKMEEFQRKMEIWQEENAVKMEEFQRKLEEQFKKKDNSRN
jgi:hypothetical protein